MQRSCPPRVVGCIVGACLLLAVGGGCGDGSSTGTGSGARAWPTSVDRLEPDARTGRVAASLLRDPDKTCPLVVVDLNGELEFTSQRTPAARHADEASGWLPGGECLVFGHGRPGATGSYRDGFFDVAVLSIEDGQTESLSGGRGGLKHGRPVAGDAIVCRVAPNGPTAAGLYIYRRTSGGWTPDPILTDADGRQWTECVWGRGSEQSQRLVVKAEETQPLGKVWTTYWTVDWLEGEEREPVLAATFREIVSGDAVSPDGGTLAVVWGDRPRPHRLVLVSLGDAPGATQEVDCGRGVRSPAFSPSGQRLSVWSPGWMDATERRTPARILLVGLAELTTREVRPRGELVSWAPFITSVAWWSDDALAIGIEDEGIGRLDLVTGEFGWVWRLPEGDGPLPMED
jgi:hypothetical protein